MDGGTSSGRTGYTHYKGTQSPIPNHHPKYHEASSFQQRTRHRNKIGNSKYELFSCRWRETHDAAFLVQSQYSSYCAYVVFMHSLRNLGIFCNLIYCPVHRLILQLNPMTLWTHHEYSRQRTISYIIIESLKILISLLITVLSRTLPALRKDRWIGVDWLNVSCHRSGACHRYYTTKFSKEKGKLNQIIIESTYDPKPGNILTSGFMFCSRKRERAKGSCQKNKRMTWKENQEWSVKIEK